MTTPCCSAVEGVARRSSGRASADRRSRWINKIRALSDQTRLPRETAVDDDLDLLDVLTGSKLVAWVE